MNDLNQKVMDDIASLLLAVADQPNKALCGPAEFWESLSDKHMQLLRKYGFQRFKRVINFEYHQWGVRKFSHPMIRQLLKRLLGRHQVPQALFWTRVKWEDISDICWPDAVSDSTEKTSGVGRASLKSLLAYAVYVGLLWQYALYQDRLGCLAACDEPTLGCPLPITYKGKLISQDLATSAIELNHITEHIDLSKINRIGEIGAGYGRLAYMTVKMFPHIEYCIFDIPPALAVAQNYLAYTLGLDTVAMYQEYPFISVPDASGQRVKAFLPHQLELVPDRSFGLVINVSSFDEMSPEQVENYFSLIERKCNGWLYLKGYREGRSPTKRLGLEEFPYRQTWREIYSAPDPVAPLFVEKVYRLRANDTDL